MALRNAASERVCVTRAPLARLLCLPRLFFSGRGWGFPHSPLPKCPPSPFLHPSVPRRAPWQVVTFEGVDGEAGDAELDAADFEAVEYINRRFPTEAALEGLDVYLARTDREVKHLDDAISEVCV
jgi:hypothetical protein